MVVTVGPWHAREQAWFQPKKGCQTFAVGGGLEVGDCLGLRRVAALLRGETGLGEPVDRIEPGVVGARVVRRGALLHEGKTLGRVAMAADQFSKESLGRLGVGGVLEPQHDEFVEAVGVGVAQLYSESEPHGDGDLEVAQPFGIGVELQAAIGATLPGGMAVDGQRRGARVNDVWNKTAGHGVNWLAAPQQCQHESIREHLDQRGLCPAILLDDGLDGECQPADADIGQLVPVERQGALDDVAGPGRGVIVDELAPHFLARRFVAVGADAAPVLLAGGDFGGREELLMGVDRDLVGKDPNE